MTCLNLFQLQVLLVNCRIIFNSPSIPPPAPQIPMPFKVFIPIMLSFNNVGTNSMDNMMDYASDV